MLEKEKEVKDLWVVYDSLSSTHANDLISNIAEILQQLKFYTI